MKSTRTLFIALAVAFTFHGCASEQQGDGLGSASVSATVPALSVGDVARIQVTVSGPNITPDIVAELMQDVGTGEWSGLIEDIPAGTDREFVAEAFFDATDLVIYSGSATGVTIEDGVQATVQFFLQQSTPPDPFANTVPLFESLVVSSAEVAPGKDVALTVAVSDPDPGDVPTLLWTATPTGGSFNVTDAPSVVWTAPSTEGFYSLTVAVSDSTGATSTLIVTIDVRIYYGWGSALIQIDVNAWPQVQSLVPSPVHIDVGETTELDLTVSDLDGDPLTYAWSANCAGSFSDTSAEDPSFTLAAGHAGAVCTLTVTIDDGRGGISTASVAISTELPTAVASFTPLGQFAGSYGTRAIGVSADGSTAVGQGYFPSELEAFRWTQAEGMVGLGDFPGPRVMSSAWGASADGSVVVGDAETFDYDTYAFRWTPTEGMVSLFDLPGGFILSAARGVSADGSVVVGLSQSGNGREAFVWTELGGMVGLGDLAGGDFHSSARGVSADGLVVVGQSVSLNGWEAFRWTEAGGMVGLGDLPGGIFSSSAYAASADGSVVVGLSSSGPSAEAFRWTEADGMVGLGHLDGQDYSVAKGVSADGSVVVGDSHGPATYSAFVWTAADGMRALKDLLVEAGVDLTGWRLDYASAVSADGTTIAGSGRDPNGDTEAWVATLPLPEEEVAP